MKNNLTLRDYLGPDTTKKAVLFNDRKYLGYVYQEVDGFYVFVDDKNNNCVWNEHNLREIANLLKGLNADWNAKIEQYFKDNDIE